MKQSFKTATARDAALLCLNCSERESLPADELERLTAHLAEHHRYETVYATVLVFGVCEACRQ